MRDHTPKTPEDMIADDGTYFEKNGNQIRKGTMAATIENADILMSDNASKEEKNAALQAIKEMVPTLKAFGLMTHLQWKDNRIQKLFEDE